LVALYEPLTITLNNWDGASNSLTSVDIPDGDGYSSITVASDLGTEGSLWNITFPGGSVISLNTTQGAGVDSAAGSIGRFTYNFTSTGTANQTKLYIHTPGGGIHRDPAVIIMEEQDDNTLYEGMLVTLETGATSDDGIGINDVLRTWHGDATWEEISLASNSKITEEADLFGTIARIDSGDSDQKSAVISYPDEQVTANIYVGEKTSSVEGGTSSGGSVKELGSVTVMDTEVSSVATKNLIVVGGSCVNSVAADLLGGALCGADFETSTGVGSGSFLVQTFSRSGDKVATLVAGYNAGDTTNAAKFLTTQTVDTTVGKKYKGSSATSAELVTTTS
jgi:hypothetical protein